MRFLSGRKVTLSHTFSDDAERAVVPSSVSVNVWNAQGVNVFTRDAVTPVEGVFTVDIPRIALAPGQYRVEWESTDYLDAERFEVVGGLLFTVAEARNADSELVDTTNYPVAEIQFNREIVATEFETVTARSFVPRTVTIDVETDGSDAVWLGKLDVESVTAFSGDDVTPLGPEYPVDRNGVLSGLSVLPEGTRVRCVVDYGLREVPADVKRVALIRLGYLLAARDSGVPDRATSFVAAEGGTYTLATPGRNGYRIGIPEVDAVLNAYSRRILADTLAAVG